MNLYTLKPRKDKILFYLTDLALKCGLTPNKITALGLSFGIACGIFFAYQIMAIGFLIGILSIFCDVLDGAVARNFALKTRFGVIFDSVADRLSELTIIIGALFAGIIYPIGVLAIVGSSLLLLMRVLSDRCGMKSDYVWFGRVERVMFILFGLISPFILLSTIFFIIAGGFGFVSSIQISATLLNAKLRMEKSRTLKNECVSIIAREPACF
jgi:phosphatidylglycerophosphate synthase